MSRVKYGPSSRARRKKISKMAKGQRGARSKSHRIALESVKRALAYSTRDRRVKKREFRKLWVIRVSNVCRENGISYSKFIKGLKDHSIHLDRKNLAYIAINDKESFKKLVDKVKENVTV